MDSAGTSSSVCLRVSHCQHLLHAADYNFKQIHTGGPDLQPAGCPAIVEHITCKTVQHEAAMTVAKLLTEPGVISAPEHVSNINPQAFGDLLKRMVSHRPEKRPGPSEVRAHFLTFLNNFADQQQLLEAVGNEIRDQNKGVIAAFNGLSNLELLVRPQVLMHAHLTMVWFGSAQAGHATAMVACHPYMCSVVLASCHML